MLIILSDLHLGDDTCGKSISADAFQVFAERLKEMAMRASWRADGSYRPIEEITILLLGDILDPLHSTRWLDTQPKDQNYTRPWSDQNVPAYAEKVREITRAILKKNAASIRALRNLEVTIPSNLSTSLGWMRKRKRVEVKTNIHYMIGNHDWYYGIPGEAFNAIREEIVDAFGLAQDSSPFPHIPDDAPSIAKKLAAYKVYAVHGDKHDPFNYNKKNGRIYSALGDVFTVEMLNRFPLEVARRLPEVPPAVIENLREISRVRPVLAAWLWVSSQIKHNHLPQSMQRKIKKIWHDLGDDFLALDVVRTADKRFQFDNVDKLEIALQLSKMTPAKTLNDLLLWVQDEIWGGEISYAKKALEEPAFLNKEARYIVYGHTHHHEIVPLDTSESLNSQEDQYYLNSGTWHTYFDLTIHQPREQKFVSYQTVSYLIFYQGDQRKGKAFETLSSTFP